METSRELILDDLVRKLRKDQSAELVDFEDEDRVSEEIKTVAQPLLGRGDEDGDDLGEDVSSLPEEL